MFSAYDIKKILPRAVFALVGISLSWALMNILINFMGFLGDSIESIILDSFSAASSQLTTVKLDATTGGWFVALAALAVGSAGLGLIPVLGLLLAGVTGVGLAFIIILIRRVALVALVVLAPLAIAMSVLPQTEKIFKNWWEWFFKLLLMYPFLMAMFAFSRVAAGIFSITGSDSSGAGITSTIYQFAAIAILIAPYFLVGKAFSFAGGTIGKLAGMVNNKDKGLIDKTKKWEAGKVAERRTDAKAGSRYGGRNFVTRGINTSLRSIANPRSAVGNHEDRDARVLAAVQRNAGTMESRHEAAKTLSRDELTVLGAVSDEREAAAVIAGLAQERALTNGTDEAHERALLNAAYRTARAKVGGSVDSSSQYYALQRAVAEGALTPEQAAVAVSRLTGKMATSGTQQTRLAETIEASLDGAAAGAGYIPGSVSRHGEAQRTGGAPAPIDQATIEGIFRGGQALGYDRLGAMREDQFGEVAVGKQQAVTDSIIALGTAATPADTDASVQELIQHRADLIVAQRAAAKANNSQVSNQALQSIAAIDAQLGAGPAAAHAANIITESQTQAQARLAL